jgi:hypothetical protein
MRETAFDTLESLIEQTNGAIADERYKGLGDVGKAFIQIETLLQLFMSSNREPLRRESDIARLTALQLQSRHLSVRNVIARLKEAISSDE